MNLSQPLRNHETNENRKEEVFVEVDKLLAIPLKEIAETLLENDEYYQMLSTSLKSAEVIKAQEKSAIEEQLNPKDLRYLIQQASTLIMEQMPLLISAADFEKLKEELSSSPEKIAEKTEKNLNHSYSENSSSELSEQSLGYIYALAYTLIQEDQYSQAETILTLLTLLVPGQNTYWIALGISLQGQKKFQEASDIFEISKILNPQDPTSFILAAQTDLFLDDIDAAREELSKARNIQDIFSGEIENLWLNVSEQLKNKM